ncbi:MAG: hypothetical protein ACKORK_01565, partial [Gemmatimonadota bacterium]
MVGEHAEAVGPAARRQKETAREDADGEGDGRAIAAACVEQLLQPLRLPRVVAEDHRRRAIPHERTETPEVALIAAEAGDARTVTFPIRPPEKVERDLGRLGALVRDGTPTVILCANAGQSERREALLDARGGDRAPVA